MDGLQFNCSTCGNIYDSNDDLRQQVDVIHGHSDRNIINESLLVEDLSELQGIDFDNISDGDKMMTKFEKMTI